MTDLLFADAPEAAVDVSLAGRGVRLVAFLIDAVLLACIQLPGAIFRLAGNATLALASDAILLIAFAALVIWLLAIRGQTPGKILMKIAIVDPATGFPPGYLHAAVIRQGPQTVLGFVNPILGGAYLLVDSLFIFSASRRCIHDRLAGTIVIRVSRAWP
jgi:uncharacterized RDD family membrane protein YckC